MNFISPNNGEVSYKDNDQFLDYSSLKKQVEMHKKITFLPELEHLYMDLTGRDHLNYYARLWSGKKDNVDRVINRLNIQSYVDTKVATYSLGMKQRLAFAMILCANTPIMLMDEVMNGLDPENVSLVSDVLIELRQDKKIVMIASHLLDNLDEYADKVFFLKDKELHRINDLNEERPLFYKIIVNDAQVKQLENEDYLTENTLHLSNQVLCIPIADLTPEQDHKLYEKLRELNAESIEISPLGTSEYYSYLYGLRIYSFDRGQEAHEEV